MNAAQYTAKKLAQLKEHEAKNQVIKTKDNRPSEDRELNKKFWRSLATGQPENLREVNDLVRKDFKDRGFRYKAQTVGTVGSGTGGGILVPTTIADSIISKMKYISPIRQIATVIPNMPAQLQLPSENTMAVAYWVAEGAPVTESGEVFDPNLLTPYKLGGYDTFTSEVIADAATNPAIESYVESRFAIAMALKENDAFVNGDGSGKPYGFRSSAITPGSVAQQGDTIGYTDCTLVKYSLPTAYRNMGVFVTSSVGMQALENVRDNYGRPIFRQGLTEGTPDKLLNRPIYLVDEIPVNLGATTDTTELWYGYFGNYFVGDRGPLRIDYGTNGNDFINDKIGLRMLRRVAGRPVLGESFTKLTGVR
jgi:HK97 family phage major capsid protein